MDGNEFFALDEIDIEVFNQLLRRSADFKILHEDDKRVLIWFIINEPQRIQSYIDYLGKHYERKSIEINAANLYEDVKAIP